MTEMRTFEVNYPESLLLSLKEEPGEFEREARLLLATKYYELGKLSSGMAAQLAGIPRVQFLLALGRYRISPFQVEIEEVLDEARHA